MKWTGRILAGASIAMAGLGAALADEPAVANLNIQADSVPKDIDEKKEKEYYIAEYSGWAIHSEYPYCKIRTFL